jgi:hypothetical protein
VGVTSSEATHPSAEESSFKLSGVVYWLQRVARGTQIEQHDEGSRMKVTIHVGGQTVEEMAIIKMGWPHTNLGCWRRILKNPFEELKVRMVDPRHDLNLVSVQWSRSLGKQGRLHLL